MRTLFPGMDPYLENPARWPGIMAFAAAMVPVLFSYGGWHTTTFVAGEVHEPRRNLARGLVLGVSGVIVLYLAVNYVCLRVLGVDELALTKSPAAEVMARALGPPGAALISAGIAVSALGFLSQGTLTSPRVYYAMARDRLFFQRVATTNRFRVPAAALVAQAIWTAFLTLPRTVTINVATHEVAYGNVYNQLLEYIVSADLLFYVLMIAALMVLRRKRPDADRPYRTWGYPLVPIISILVAGLLTIDLAFLAPATSGIGMLIVLSGVPVYFFWRKGATA